MINAENFIIEHHKITKASLTWDLSNLLYVGGTKVYRQRKNWHQELQKLPVANERIWLIKELTEYLKGMLETGNSVASVEEVIKYFKQFISFTDQTKHALSDKIKVKEAMYSYSEFLYQRSCRQEIKPNVGYVQTVKLMKHLNYSLEINLNITKTRLRKKSKSRRAISREADKTNLQAASKLAQLAYDITQNFNPDDLSSEKPSIFVKVRNSLLAEPLNLTPKIGKNKPNSPRTAFNNRVSAEFIIFLGMTTANISPTHNLKRCKFDYKLNKTGDKYELREYKHRKGGEVLIKIPRPYRKSFESFLSFLDEYAPESEWLFPYKNSDDSFEKRGSTSINPFRRLCLKHGIPWIAPSQFRTISLNLLLRLSADEITASEYGNHGLGTFRESYEFPSQQRAMVEIARFWDESDPLTLGKPKVSLFGTSCTGNPEPFSEIVPELVQPDCQTPTGCINCKHYRDEESLDYVWNLCSFRYLKIIESNSYLNDQEKPSNIAIDWANLKIKWFKKSENPNHQNWVQESEMKIEEGDYHPHWSRRIDSYEG